MITSGSSLKKPYPIPDQNRQSLYLFSGQNAAKLLPFGAAHTYMAYIRWYVLEHMVSKIQEWLLLPQNHSLPFYNIL